MDYEKVRSQFGNWDIWMKDLIESEMFNDLYRLLKGEKQKGREILPASGDVWKSLRLVDRTKVRAIILLQCPYATKREINKVPVVISNGIPIDCQNIAPYQQPSLHHWWQAIEDQYRFHPDNDNRCDLSYLLEEEHVLLMNTSNTVELNKVDSHQIQWHQTMKWFCEHVINKWLPGIPICMVGTQAQKFEQYLNPMANPLLKVEHPAAAAYANREWRHQNMHKWCNEIIRQNNGPSEMVVWMRKKSDGKKVDEKLPPWITGEELPSAESLNLPWKDNK